MALDDLDTWRVMHSQFVGADCKSGISFALNNDPEAEDSYTVRIITSEMSHRNSPWNA